MLTRLEVDGFKNLLDLRVEFGPFTCIAGENGTGKSNVFDAIQFLSLLADRSMIEAAQAVRGTHGSLHGDARDLFWNGYAEGEHLMTFAAEMIIPGEVEDDFGRLAEPTSTFLRYELRLGYQPPRGGERGGRLTLLYEDLSKIRPRDAASQLRFPHSAKGFRNTVVRGRPSTAPYISTSLDTGDAVVQIHADGRRGQPRPAPASRAPGTMLSTINRNDDPTILAARREMQSWRRLALEPSALRTSDRYQDPSTMQPDGLHLPRSLDRIAREKSPDDPARVYSRVAGRLSDLSGLHVRTLHVEADDTRELLTIKLHEIDGMELPARSLSEGTLRFLALCVLLEDPSAQGLLCMEEPENGIHPANLLAMVNLVRDLAVDPSEPVDEDNPFRQVLINTHSPGVVQLVDPADLLIADTATVPREGSKTARALRLRPLAGTWRAGGVEKGYGTVADILAYLTSPPQARLTLEESAS
ncbi:AAA family ATPase [Streptomyces alkaliterrae]|uniref:AAA family ATPase n=1 Tax=Streptomyces alkaliterrae TaxID=2213162 RepID=A0A5P0YKQ8_9ACTN|nr:AAA family ATPase [Streptomyces alkaliterrae]MBB1258135.1 AAA family ATPase [Streptomyces alkaliterrae]MQS00886.1 AAA family ATPase [Streptomyces alkaliterrae]